MNPKISIILPVYNGEKYLSEAINSILNQTYRDFELLIIDGSSTDNTPDIIQSFHDNRIKYFKKDHNGLVNSLNFGLEHAVGEFIARQDADDISLPLRFEKQIDFFERNPEYVLAGSYASSIDEFGENLGELNYPPLAWKDIKKYAYLHNPFIHPTVMFRKNIIEEVGRYKKFKHAEDYEFWTRIIYKYPCTNIGESLLKYRILQDRLRHK